jgi:hypothetical protein
MAKSILVFIRSRPFGVFSNKTNAWLAVQSQFDPSQLVCWSEKRNVFLPASYSVLASRMKKDNKVSFVDAEQARDNVTETLVPVVHMYQMITNVAVDGVLYKSNADDSLEPQEEVEESEEVQPVNTGV